MVTLHMTCEYITRIIPNYTDNHPSSDLSFNSSSSGNIKVKKSFPLQIKQASLALFFHQLVCIMNIIYKHSEKIQSYHSYQLFFPADRHARKYKTPGEKCVTIKHVTHISSFHPLPFLTMILSKRKKVNELVVLNEIKQKKNSTEMDRISWLREKTQLILQICPFRYPTFLYTPPIPIPPSAWISTHLSI